MSTQADGDQEKDASERRPWLRRPKESREAFAAFSKYRDQEGRRSISTVATSLKKPQTLIERWSTENEWVARARAYDEHLDDLVTEKRIEFLLKELERRQATHEHLRNAILVQSKKLEEEGCSSPLELLRVARAARAIEDLDRQRSIRGEARLVIQQVAKTLAEVALDYVSPHHYEDFKARFWATMALKLDTKGEEEPIELDI